MIRGCSQFTTTNTNSTYATPYTITTGYDSTTPYTVTTDFTYSKSLYQDWFKETYLKKDNISKIQVDFENKKVDLTDKILQIKKEQDLRFINVIERNPGRVYEFVFQDNTHIKTVCAEEDLDIFDLYYAFFLALAKYLYGKDYTLEGVLNKTTELMDQKKYIKIVKEGMKLFKEKQNKKEEIETEKRRIKAIKKNHHLKNERRKAAKQEKELKALKQIIIEALNDSKEEN